MVIRVLVSVVVLFATFSLGIWYGYDKGVKNHIVYDAPARIALYDAAIKSDDPIKVLRNLAINQAMMMNSLRAYSNAMLLKLPVHNGAEELYFRYLPVAEAYSKQGNADSGVATPRQFNER